ncbi:MAG: efflux RND transporter permease subunit, partial [Bacteroidota bacterium]
MKISDYAVKNYQFTLVIFLMAIAVGVTTLMNMPRSEDPVIEAPQFAIVAVYPGTSPADMEELVIDPIEKEIYGLENIKRIRTETKNGVMVMRVDYVYESDVTEKYQELTREVNNLRSDLPDELYSIEVRKFSPSQVNILQIGLVSENASRRSLKDAAEQLQDRLEKVDELKLVKVFGIPDEVARIDLQLEKIAQMNIPLNAILGSIQSELANIPGGTVEAGTKAFSVKT